MRIAIQADDVSVSEDVLAEVGRELSARTTSPAFAGAQDLRLRFLQAKNALLAVVAVGFAGGALVTSTAEGASPVDAVVSALDELPARKGRLEGARASAVASPLAEHAAFRTELSRLLARAGA